MTKLYRPYISVDIRLAVATRMLKARDPGMLDLLMTRYRGGKLLKAILDHLFEGKPFALDHNPALVNRMQRTMHFGTVIYSPAANDPRYLLYRESGPGSDHDIKTRVRGDGAQLSDLAIARKRRRMEHKRKSRTTGRWAHGRKIQSRGFR